MKKIGLLLAIALGLCLEPRDPSELQIRTAFEQALNNPLHSVILAADAGASGRVLGSATEIRALRKLGCVSARPSAYVCDFFVDLRAGDAQVRRTVSGYFLDGPGPLTFAREIQADVPPVPAIARAATSGSHG